MNNYLFQFVLLLGFLAKNVVQYHQQIIKLIIEQNKNQASIEPPYNYIHKLV